MDTTSVSLLARLRRPDDPAAWGRFVELYTPLLYYWARRTGLQACDAADLVQDVFGVLVQKMPEFAYDAHKNFRAWLRTVTLNKWRENGRKRARRPAAGDAALADLAAPDDPDAFAEAEYRQHLLARALQVMRAEFPEAAWKACWEVTAHGRPAREVAAELGLSESAVYVAKFRVLRRLRAELHGLLD